MIKLTEILEGILNEDYLVSRDPEKILFDFYVLGYINTINLDVTSKGYAGSFIGKDPEELKSLIEDAENKLLPYLKEEILDAVFYSLGCEIRHADVEDLESAASHDAETDNNYEYFKKTWPILNKYFSIIRKMGVASDSNSRDASNRIIKRLVKNKPDFVEGMKFIFDQDYAWDESYGGEAWANICSGWLRLYNATTKREIYVAIDHVYDLQHNNDSVFNKVKRYLKFPVDSYTEYAAHNTEWLTNALDLKANIKNIHTLFPLCSSDMRKIASMVLKRANIAKPKPETEWTPVKLYDLLENEIAKKWRLKEVRIKLKADEDYVIRLSYGLTKDWEPSNSMNVFPMKKSNENWALEFLNPNKPFIYTSKRDPKRLIDLINKHIQNWKDDEDGKI